MTLLPHLAARLFGTPLMIHRPKLEVILAVLGPRIGLSQAESLEYMPPTRPSPVLAPGIAILPVHGSLVRRTGGLEAASGLASYQSLTELLDEAILDPGIAAILLDIDSPGGESGGVFDLAERIRVGAQKKPIWAVANDMACSAAYAIASGATRVFVTRTGCVGSIGVIAMHADQSVKDAQEGMHYTTVFAGKRKNDMNPHVPLSSEAHALLQTEVDRIYELFLEIVSRHRGLSLDAVRATEAGLFFGADAVSAGLADSVGNLEDALTELVTSLQPAEKHRSRGRAPAFLSHPPLEISMNDHTDHLVGGSDNADPASPPAQDTPATLTVEDAQEIAELCHLAGFPERTARYLATRTAPALVRRELLSDRAQSTEISSRIAPQSLQSTSQPLDNNPIVMAARARAGKEK